MHLKDTFPNHIIETKIPVSTKEMDFATGKYVETKKVVRIHEWLPGKKGDISDILRRNQKKIRKSLKKNTPISPKNGTIAGIPMKVVHITYPDHTPTTQEIGCPPIHKWWRCETRRGKKVIVTSLFSTADAKAESYEACMKKHRLFVPEAVFPLPKNWVVKPGQKGCIINPPLSEEDKYEIFKASFASTDPADQQAPEQFYVEDTTLFRETFPEPKRVQKKGYIICTRGFKHSEKILYRLLHWMGHIQVKPGNFYKGHLLTLMLGKTGAMADFFFYKKEIACELWVPKNKAILPTKPKPVGPIQITCGVPGSKRTNAPTATPDVMEKWNLLHQILQTKTSIYSGNNFLV